ncbi:uncharacterized protein [Branchiostoma lanceolatum]|uniref:uncharacterized protein isoform X2 n=1 Tax=Branchiostoma lanceolatum TaxID=7740 RepID=UPI003456EE51
MAEDKREPGWYLALMAPNSKGSESLQWSDTTAMYRNAEAFHQCVADLTKDFQPDEVHLVAGIDATGFILGGAIACHLKKGFLAIRKYGNLCVEVDDVRFKDYSKKEKRLEIRKDAFKPGTKVLIVDQWIETGGTMAAAVELVERQQGIVADSCSIGRSFCLIATVVLVGSGATIATILTMMFHNTKEHDIQTPKPTQDSRHWTTVNLTAPAVIAGSVSTNIHILHSTNGKVRPMGLNPPNMTEPSGKTGPILPGDAVSNRPIGPPVPPTPPLPPSEMEPMGRAGPVEQNGRDGVPRSPRPTKPPKGKGPVGSQDLPEPVGFFGPPVGLQRRPTYPFERPQTNIGGKSDKVSCKGGYTVFRGICYKVFKIYQTFSEAAETCRANGGTLAMPRDALTNNFLISLYQKSVSNDPLWFGLHDRREEGKFEWADGSPLGEYSSWGALRPDNGLFARFQNCVQYPNYNGLTIAGSRWYDNNCDLRFFFICQVIPGNETA